MPIGRMFEYTDEHLLERFSKNGKPELKKLAKLPTLFMEEGAGEQLARLGTISAAQISGQEIRLEYTYDLSIPPITNKQLKKIAGELDIRDFEFSRTHWGVKDVDLFRVLLRNAQPSRHRPKVFRIAEPELIETTLVSVMMPFDASFKLVYSRIKKIVESFGLRCSRADDIWEHPSVIQDVVSLIDRSQLVICDCSQRNPNVFYEIGIAHTLGRDVILITQSGSDIPFDLRHLRYVEYLNNKEGRKDLAERLREKLSDIAS
jgi:hypothetical protein